MKELRRMLIIYLIIVLFFNFTNSASLNEIPKMLQEARDQMGKLKNKVGQMIEMGATLNALNRFNFFGFGYI